MNTGTVIMPDSVATGVYLALLKYVQLITLKAYCNLNVNHKILQDRI